MILNEAIIYDEVLATPYLTRWSTTDRLGLVFSDGDFSDFTLGQSGDSIVGIYYLRTNVTYNISPFWISKKSYWSGGINWAATTVPCYSWLNTCCIINIAGGIPKIGHVVPCIWVKQPCFQTNLYMPSWSCHHLSSTPQLPQLHHLGCWDVTWLAFACDSLLALPLVVDLVEVTLW